MGNGGGGGGVGRLGLDLQVVCEVERGDVAPDGVLGDQVVGVALGAVEGELHARFCVWSVPEVVVPHLR